MADTIRRVYEIDAKISTTAQQSLREIQRSLREVEAAGKAVGKSSKDLGKDVEEAGSAFSHLNFKSVGARRELLVLAHELSQGQYKAFAGSLLVLGERIDATALIMSAAGLSAIALGAAISLVAIAVVKGALEQNIYNKSIVLTSNAAGTTNDSILQLSKSIAGQTKATAGSVVELARALAATGEIGPKAFAPLLEVMARVQKLTGETSEEVASKFKNFADSPTKSAIELNKQLNFLDSSMYKQILRLEELGQKEAAVALAADAATAALKDRQLPTLGLLQTGYEALLRGLDRISHYFHAIGAETTFEAKLDSLYKKLGDLDQRANNPTLLNRLAAFFRFGGLGGSAAEEEAEAARAEIAAVIRAKTERENKAAQDADDARTKKAGLNAQIRLDDLDKATKGYNRQKKELAELKGLEDALVKDRQRTDPTFQINPVDHARRVAEIVRRNRTQDEKSLSTAIETRLRTLGAESIALQEQIKQYEEYGKKVTNAARAKVDFDLKQGNLKGAGSKDAKALRAIADEVDAQQALLKQTQSLAQADTRIKQLKAEAEARSTNARELQIAVELGKLEADGILKGTPAYESRAAAIRKYTNEIHDNALARKLATQEDATSDEARAISDQIGLIGKSTLEREKYTAALRVQRQVTKELAENPESAFEIIASATRRIELLTEALDENYKAQRKFESGAKQAFSAYLEDASNAAKFSNEIIGGSLKQVEDLFVNFAKTGKLNFKDLFTYMADEFIRQSVRMSISGILKEGGAEGAITSAFKSLAGVFGINFEGGNKSAASGAVGAAAEGGLASLGATSATVATSFGILEGTIFTTDLGMTSLTLAAETAAAALFNVGGSGAGGAAGSIFDAASEFDWEGLFQFANGGIMSSAGSLPLKMYAGGGIANSPQMAVFGEGRMNEAYVPLPDGRSIPVTMKSTEQGSSGPLNVTIENHGGSDVSVKRQKNALGKEELRIFVRAAKQEILDDIYSGGEVDKAMSDKYGVDRASGTPRSGR